jgi:FAD:protein FMN transferase
MTSRVAELMHEPHTWSVVRWAALSCWVAGIPACAWASATSTEAKLEGRTMGTTYHATVEHDSDVVTESEIHHAIDDRLSQINSRMSTYDKESELSRFNASRSTDWFAVSRETAVVVTAALEMARRTGGAFDPTVGPLVNLWGFGPDGRRSEPPSDQEIQQALAKLGYPMVEARLDPPALRKSNPEAYLDLSAIAKGYAADAVVELLGDAEQSNIDSRYAMVEIGGEVRTLNTRPSNSAWRIGIERPDTDARLITKIVEIANGDALATSGDYRNFFTYHQRRYSHTIDPATGRPVEHQLATVTVRAPTCMQADALATALLVMGPEKGLAWANSEKVAAVLIERTDLGFREHVSQAWASFNNAAAGGLPSENQENIMVTYFVISAIVFAIALAGMAIGVLLSNRRIKGTCGGLAGMQDSSGKTACEMCSDPSPTCTGNPEQRAETVEH